MRGGRGQRWRERAARGTPRVAHERVAPAEKLRAARTNASRTIGPHCVRSTAYVATYGF